MIVFAVSATYARRRDGVEHVHGPRTGLVGKFAAAETIEISHDQNVA